MSIKIPYDFFLVCPFLIFAKLILRVQDHESVEKTLTGKIAFSVVIDELIVIIHNKRQKVLHLFLKDMRMRLHKRAVHFYKKKMASFSSLL